MRGFERIKEVKMMPIAENHRFVTETDEDQVRAGGRDDPNPNIRGDDPARVCPPLGEVVQEIVDHFQDWVAKRRKGDSRQIQAI